MRQLGGDWVKAFLELGRVFEFHFCVFDLKTRYAV
jgi:hypothetical protein